MINIDRSWFYWEDIIEYINEAAMASQIIIKSPVDKTLLTTLKEKGPSIMYMPITKSVADVETVKAMALNTVAFEMIVDKDTDTLADKAYLSSLKVKDTTYGLTQLHWMIKRFSRHTVTIIVRLKPVITKRYGDTLLILDLI
ncbi:hypothetical protein MGH68_04675 [Erysipelothrix sp. D19-032]